MYSVRGMPVRVVQFLKNVLNNHIYYDTDKCVHVNFLLISMDIHYLCNRIKIGISQVNIISLNPLFSPQLIVS